MKCNINNNSINRNNYSINLALVVGREDLNKTKLTFISKPHIFW